MKLKYPVDVKYPVFQKFGEDPAYYSKIRDAFGIGMKGHNGWDLAVPIGTPVFASHDGTVWFAGTDISEAKTVIIDTPDGLFRTFYSHLSDYSVTPGQVVKQGEQIGLSGNTGKYTGGAHLHFGIHRISNYSDIEPANGYSGACDPAPFFNGLNRNLTLMNTGEDVRVLQDFLKAKGFLQINTTTQYFGYATLSAVRKFQQANGLTPSVGFCGEKTRALINKQLN